MSRPLHILVAVKRVPAPGARINVTDDGQDVDTRHLGFTTSPHEECAVEAAVQLMEQHGGETTVITLGPPDAAEQLRYALSVGANQAVLLAIEGPDWDPSATATALVDAVKQLEDANGQPFDLIIFGNESADSGGYQVGIRVGHGLGRATINGAKGLSVADDEATVYRDIDAGQEIYQIPLPAVVGVKEGINLPRYPTMKGRLASKKADIGTLNPHGEPGGLKLVSLEQPEEQTTETTILGTGPDAAPAIVDVLAELGVLT